MKRAITLLFKKHNVCVCGMQGAGKDLLLGNVYVRLKKPYVSNQNFGGKYKGEYYPSAYNMGGNTYLNLLRGDVMYYEYPHEKGTDIIISDAGIYFPSQYCGELNRDFKGQPLFSALARQLGRAHVHVNTQNLGRVWDKIREQSDVYIYCEKCIYIPVVNFVIQSVIVYDKAESAQARVKPCRVTVPLLGDKNARMNARIYRDQFYNQHGEVKRYTLFYFNRSKHNTYQFEEVFKNGRK